MLRRHPFEILSVSFTNQGKKDCGHEMTWRLLTKGSSNVSFLIPFYVGGVNVNPHVNHNLLGAYCETYSPYAPDRVLKRIYAHELSYLRTSMCINAFTFARVSGHADHDAQGDLEDSKLFRSPSLIPSYGKHFSMLFRLVALVSLSLSMWTSILQREKNLLLLFS